MYKNLPNFNKLSDHEFVLIVLADAIPLMKPGSHVDDYELNSRNRYVGLVGYYVGQALNQIERIDQAGILLNSYPRIHAWRTRYGRFEYFQYHMEQYFIALSGLVDRLLLLVNHLYQLGLKDEEARLGNVIKALKKQSRDKIVEMLNELRISTHEIKLKKNDYTHSIRFWEKSLWHIGLREFALKNKTVNDDDGYLKEDLQFDIKLYKYEKMKLIIDNEKALYESLSLIYTEFNNEYRVRLDNLRIS